MVELAISLKQPWAWAVFEAGKDIENRTWWTTYRGPVWIASSAQVTRAYYEDAAEFIETLTGVRVPPREELVHGAILGKVTIADCILPGGYCVQPGTSKPPEASERHPLHPARWHAIDQFGYVLRDRRVLDEPVRCKGLQRFWRIPADVLEQIRGAG